MPTKHPGRYDQDVSKGKNAAHPDTRKILTDLVMANATNISVSEEDWGRKHADWAEKAGLVNTEILSADETERYLLSCSIF